MPHNPIFYTYKSLFDFLKELSLTETELLK